MHLRVWDDAMDFPKFNKALRLVDQTMSELQLKTLFKNLKNADGLVDINVLIRNLTGKDFATVDFRERVYRQLYNEIFPNNEERILKLFQEIDTTNCGLIKHD
jgi:Ca2+-binding EF-hand superfamily protein